MSNLELVINPTIGFNSKADEDTQETKTSENDSLKKYAFCLAGPRDFILNVIVNACVSWYSTQKLVFSSLIDSNLAKPSVFTLLVPMAFILVTLTSFSGFLGGLCKGKINLKTIIWHFTQNTGWLKPTLIVSLLLGSVSAAIFILVLKILQATYPPIVLSTEKMILLQSLLAGFMAYFVQVASSLNAKKLKIRKLKLIE